MTPVSVFRNPHRIKSEQALKDSGFRIEDCFDAECPACCDEGCIVEPDGVCSHGCPSVLRALGMI